MGGLVAVLGDEVGGPYVKCRHVIRAANGNLYKLTPRHVEILELASQGLAYKQMAAVMGNTEQTVKNHVTAILRALDVFNMTHAVAKALREGIIGMIVARSKCLGCNLECPRDPLHNSPLRRMPYMIPFQLVAVCPSCGKVTTIQVCYGCKRLMCNECLLEHRVGCDALKWGTTKTQSKRK